MFTRLLHATAVIVSFASFASFAHADPLADLRSTLGRLQGHDPVAATLDVQRVSASGEKSARKSREGRASIDLDAGPQGLRLTFSADLLAQADREDAARRKDPESKAPIGDLLDELSPTKVAELVGAADVLLRKIDGATLKETRADSIDAKPAQLLVLDLPAHLDAEARDALKHIETELKLWLDADGVPIASEMTQKFNGRKFLIGFEGAASESSRYQHVGSRLIAASRSHQDTFAGFGQDTDTKTTMTMRLH